MTRRAFLAWALASAGTLLAACQQPTTPSRSGAPTPVVLLLTPESKPTQTPRVAAKPDALGTPVVGPPKPGGSVVWAIEADPTDLNSDELAYQSLVMIDENLKLVPGLAQAWSVSDDRLTWTFTLRQGVSFHDGSEFEAEDVRYWFERTAATQSPAPYRRLFSQLASVQPKGKHAVEVALSAPHAPLLATLAALRGSAILPRRWHQQAGAAAQTTAVGSGPYKIAEYVPGSHIQYIRHRDYWEKGLPYLDEIRLEIIPDENRRIEALRSGRVTYAMVGPSAVQPLKRDHTVLSSPGPAQVLTLFNTQRKPFDDVRVRQAIDLALDRPATIRSVLGGAGSLTGPVPPGHGEWAISPESLPYRRDIATATHLLTEAGYADGFEATIKTTPDHPSMLGTALLLAEQVKALGITLNVEQLAGPALAEALRTNDFDLASHTVGFLPDPDTYFAPYAARGRPPGSLSSWANPAYDDLVEQARMTMDPVARKNLYDRAATIVLHEAPAIWWFSEHQNEALHPSIKGYRQSFTGRRLGLKKVWLDA